MNYTITEESIMSYIHGEMDAKERAQFEKAIESQPVWKKELEQLSFLKQQLGKLEDEVPPQKVVILRDPLPAKKVKLTWLKSLVAIAAGLALLMVTAKLVNMEINTYDGGMAISFGEPKQQKNTDIDIDTVKGIFAQMLDHRDQAWKDQMTSFESSLSNQVFDQKESLQNVAHQVKNINQKPTDSYVTYDEMYDLMLKQGTKDKDENEQMMANLIEYISITHEKDLQLMQQGFSDIRQYINLAELEKQKLFASYQDNNLNQ